MSFSERAWQRHSRGFSRGSRRANHAFGTRFVPNLLSRWWWQGRGMGRKPKKWSFPPEAPFSFLLTHSPLLVLHQSSQSTLFRYSFHWTIASCHWNPHFQSVILRGLILKQRPTHPMKTQSFSWFPIKPMFWPYSSYGFKAINLTNPKIESQNHLPTTRYRISHQIL